MIDWLKDNAVQATMLALAVFTAVGALYVYIFIDVASEGTLVMVLRCSRMLSFFA